MNELLKILLQNKGTRSYRTLLLIAVVYVAVKVNEIERRVAQLELNGRANVAQVTP